ncbi:zinc finger, CCHC-type containing protein [Tanacetum coccineum]|uniref:Zinc finger, CCHC-type containing protein n=1 Tax=Tanacetum coccineum TaxID=301880 RepID=A0ABQ4XIS2_9ASTR
MVRSMMSRATLLISFWGYALETATHILKLIPTKKVLKTPFEMWKGKRPSLGHIKIWSCEVFVRREDQDKLEARSEKCLFISYPEESFGYLSYKPKDNVSTNEEPIVNTDTQQEVVTPVKPDDISLPIRRTSGRVSKPPQFYYGFHIEEDKINDSTLSELDEPANYKEAMASPEATKWKEAIKSEIQSMYDNQNSKKGNLPLHHGIKISKDLCLKSDEELDRMSRVPYASAVGSIMYAMTCTRPDVSFSLSMVSRHQQNPGEVYLFFVYLFRNPFLSTTKGDANHIRTLGDYSKPSHEGYRNTIELPVGNNVVPLRSDTIWLVQNGCSFHEIRSEDPNQHLKDFLKLVDSLDLDDENKERTRLRLFQFSLRDQASNWLERLPAGSITTWKDLTTHFLAQFFPPGRTAKLRNDILMFQQHQGESLSEAWTRFKDLLTKVPHHGIDSWLQIQIFF